MVAPDVGGGFGAKLQVYGEEALVRRARQAPGPPGQVDRDALGAHDHEPPRARPGRLRDARRQAATARSPAARCRIIADLGAYQQLLTPFIPELGFPVMGGCYRFPAIDLHFTGVFTNKMSTDAIRGAGRPEATYWIELMMDQLARELGMDPLELRRKNFIPKDEFPYETALGHRLRLGRLPGHARQAARELRPRRVPARAGAAARRGRPPRRRLLDLRGGLRPGALARGRARRASACRRRSGSRPTCA